jgi:hypothetical protein
MARVVRLIRAALACAAFASLPVAAMNAINVIAPYKHHGMWVFDDPRVGLQQEPFVAGADTMIDKAVASIPDAERGFALVFSATPFPGHQLTLEWRRNDGAGDWYYSPQLRAEGWLCPALLKYFEGAPRTIYVQVKPRA